jgi:hypothetical protein
MKSIASRFLQSVSHHAPEWMNFRRRDEVAHRQLLSRILETGEWEVYAPEKFRQVGFLLVLSGSSLMIISLALADTGKGR